MDLASIIRPQSVHSPPKYGLCLGFNSCAGGLQESDLCFATFDSTFCVEESSEPLWVWEQGGGPYRAPYIQARSGCGNAGLYLCMWDAVGTAPSTPKIRSLLDHRGTWAAFMSVSCKPPLQTLYVIFVLQLIALVSSYSVREAALWSQGLRPQTEDVRPATRRKINTGARSAVPPLTNMQHYSGLLKENNTVPPATQ